MIDYRDRRVAQSGAELIVASVQDSIDRGRVREIPGQSRNPLQTRQEFDETGTAKENSPSWQRKNTGSLAIRAWLMKTFE